MTGDREQQKGYCDSINADGLERKETPPKVHKHACVAALKKKKNEQKKNKTQKQTLSFSFTRHSKHLICQTMMLFSTSHILLIVIYFRPSLPQEGSQVTTLQRKKNLVKLLVATQSRVL